MQLLATIIVCLFATTGNAMNDSAYESLPFVEALDGLRDRTALTEEALDRLRIWTPGPDGKARIKAFEARLGLVIDTWRAALATMREGEGLHDFRKRLPEMMEAKGWTGERPFRAALIFQQQSFMAYSAGRFAQYDDAEVTRWRFVAQDDELMCPICGRLHGRVFEMGDLRFWPAVHFGCRCGTEPVFADEADGEDTTSDAVLSQIRSLRGEGGERIRKIWDQTLERPNSFRWNPQEYLGRDAVDVSRVPSELLPMVRRLAEEHGVEVAER